MAAPSPTIIPVVAVPSTTTSNVIDADTPMTDITPTAASSSSAAATAIPIPSSAIAAMPVLAHTATYMNDDICDDDDDDLGGTGNAVDDEETFAEDHQDADISDRNFDEIVGALDEMLMDDSFLSLQHTYLRTHCHHFDPGDENKLIYTSLFNEYVQLMEKFIHDYLQSRIPSFDMESFLQECEQRGESELSGDTFDMLTSMSDFAAFKELMLAQRDEQKWAMTQITVPLSPTSARIQQQTQNAPAAAAAAASVSSNSQSAASKSFK